MERSRHGVGVNSWQLLPLLSPPAPRSTPTAYLGRAGHRKQSSWHWQHSGSDITVGTSDRYLSAPSGISLDLLKTSHHLLSQLRCVIKRVKCSVQLIHVHDQQSTWDHLAGDIIEGGELVSESELNSLDKGVPTHLLRTFLRTETSTAPFCVPHPLLPYPRDIQTQGLRDVGHGWDP